MQLNAAIHDCVPEAADHFGGYGVIAVLVRVEVVDGCLHNTRPARDVSGETHKGVLNQYELGGLEHVSIKRTNVFHAAL